MSVPLPAWLSHAADGIRQLASRPVALFCLLLALNALSRPCSITNHDARLYSLQALNAAEHGAYADDVFLRFGSQDQFTLFSRVIAPLVTVLGLRLTFFVLYILFNTLFVWALFRLVRVLVEDTVVSTVALVYLVTAPLVYGGHGIFTVHEQFFTPRTVGMAFTLFALERMVRQRFLIALPLLLAGGLFHPLMVFGGVMIWAVQVACTYLPVRAFAGLVLGGAVAGGLVLGMPAIGTRLFGGMDDDWHHLIRLAVGYNYPDAWSARDWTHVSVSFALSLAGCVFIYRDVPELRRFFFAVTLAGVVGLVATVLGSMLPYALLFQGQPYRVLWILRVLQIPLGFLLIARGCASDSCAGRIGALALVAYFSIVHYLSQEFMIVGGLAALSILAGRLGVDGERSGWWWYAGARGFAVGALGWTVNRGGIFLAGHAVMRQHFDLNEMVMLDVISPIFWLVLIALVAAWSTNSAFAWHVLRWAPVGAAVITTTFFFFIEVSQGYRHDHTRLGADIDFLADFVQHHRRYASRPPSIYSSLGRPDLLWIDVGATSYFDIIQTAGVMFNRKTAMEIDRRGTLVGPFEMHHQRQLALFLDEPRKTSFERFFKIPYDCPEPTEADLVRLCHEPDLDLVVLPHEFPGQYSATNGRIFVYECYKIRANSDTASRAP